MVLLGFNYLEIQGMELEYINSIFYANHFSSINIHYRKQYICRVPGGLLNVFLRALDKQYLYRVPTGKNSAKKYTRQKTYLPSAGNKTLGKQQQDSRQRIDNRQKTTTCDGRQPGCRPLELCRVSVSDTRQRESLPSVFIWHSANSFVCRVFYFDTW